MRLIFIFTLIFLHHLSFASSDKQNLNQSLIGAILSNNAPRVQELLVQGADPNTFLPDKKSVLTLAANSGNLQIVQFLVEKGAETNDPSHPILSSYPEIVTYLLEKGANPNVSNARGTTPLHKAAAVNNLPLLAKLIEANAALNVKDKNNKLPLQYATDEIVKKYLMEKTHLAILGRKEDLRSSQKLPDSSQCSPEVETLANKIFSFIAKAEKANIDVDFIKSQAQDLRNSLYLSQRGLKNCEETKNLAVALFEVLAKEGFIFEEIESSESLSYDVEAFKKAVQERPESFPSWYPIGNYITHQKTQKKEPKLVVGCGHKAYSFKDGRITRFHGPDINSGNIAFSHGDSLTINKEMSPPLNPDIDEYFPNKVPPLPIFQEIFFEQVDGGTSRYYKDAFARLKKGGELIDDRYHHNQLPIEKKLLYETAKALAQAGFTEIKFYHHYNNPRNMRLDEKVVMAKKP